MIRLHFRNLALPAVFGCLVVRAGTNGFVVPAFRDLPGSSSAGWDRFTVATNNGVGNLPDLAGSTAPATLVQLDPNAAVLTSGNIYNMPGKSSFRVQYNGPEIAVGAIALQVRTAGTELKYDSVRLTFSETPTISYEAVRHEFDRFEFGAPGQPGSGAFVSSYWEWDLHGGGVKSKSFSLEFSAADFSLSLDSVTLDVGKVPEPSVWCLFLAGGAVLAGSRWKRNG